MIILTERLKKVAELIGKTEVLADIGCDHGHLPIYLLMKNDISYAYACDVRDGPLDSARKNILKYGLTQKTEIIKSDGLINITDKKVDVISICGMGGRLIAKILSDSLEYAKSADKLVLQPMTEVYVLRQFLADNGFVIEKEVLAREDDRFYNIISVKKGKENYNDIFSIYFGGKLINSDEPLLLPYLEKNYRINLSNLKAKEGKEDTEILKNLVENLEKIIKSKKI